MMRSTLASLAVVVLTAALCLGQPAAQSQSSRSGSYLGVTLTSVSPEAASSLKLHGTAGALITDVDQDAPAAKAGIRQKDVIVSFDGQKVQTPEDVRRLIRDKSPGNWVTLGISRDGNLMNLKVLLASRSLALKQLPHGGLKAMPPLPALPVVPRDLDIPQFTVLQFWSRNGLLIEDLTPQLGEYFGVRKGQGVLVRSVEKGSPADAAGLRAGDVIVKVNNSRVSCSSDWRHTVTHLQGTVTVGIIRDKREQTLSLKLPERRNSGDMLLPELPDTRDLGLAFEWMQAQLERLTPEIDMAMRRHEQAMSELDRAFRQMEKDLEH